VNESRLDLLERALIGSVAISLALALLVLGTGWRLDLSAWGRALSDLRPGAQAARGESLYNAYCSSCHGGATAAAFPGQVVYPTRPNASGHIWEHPDCELVTIVIDGGNEMTRAQRAVLAPTGALEMPAFRQRLTRDDVAAILAYIKTLWTEEQVRSQAQLTRDRCGRG
jgi:mono/diheme cytochrome c family protein